MDLREEQSTKPLAMRSFPAYMVTKESNAVRWDDDTIQKRSRNDSKYAKGVGGGGGSEIPECVSSPAT